MSKSLKRIVLLCIITAFDFFSSIEVAFFFSKNFISFRDILNLCNFFCVSIYIGGANRLFRR